MKLKVKVGEIGIRRNQKKMTEATMEQIKRETGNDNGE
jgi:hypothetical protein